MTSALVSRRTRQPPARRDGARQGPEWGEVAYTRVAQGKATQASLARLLQ